MRCRWLLPIALLLTLGIAGAVGRGGLSQYGGWAGVQLPATGWFRIQKVEGRWWLVDPQGYPFLSAGVEGVSLASSAGEPYRAAVSRKYGRRAWPERVTQRLRGWGFNTLGVGADPDVCRQGLPYALSLDLTARLRAESKVGFVDVFAPAFEKQARQVARRLCRRSANDASLIGYLMDEAPPWQHDDDTPAAVLGQYLGLADSAPGRAALLSFLEIRYLSIGELNGAWHTEYTDFTEIGRLPQVGAAIPEVDASDFLRLVAERYFRTVDDAVSAADPNHLRLGCRFGTTPPTPVLEAMRGHVDVSVLSGYGERPPVTALRQISRTTQRPVLVAGFSFRARDSGLPGNRGRGPLVDTQEERGELFTRYVDELLSLPMVIGYHWYQHADSAGATPSGTESGNCGLVTVEDEPYQPLIGAVTRANQGLYTRLAAMPRRVSGAARGLPAGGR